MKVHREDDVLEDDGIVGRMMAEDTIQACLRRCAFSSCLHQAPRLCCQTLTRTSSRSRALDRRSGFDLPEGGKVCRGLRSRGVDTHR
eukprot:447327-Rhodomonas_salina.1